MLTVMMNPVDEPAAHFELDALAEEYFQGALARNPVFATSLGIPGFDHLTGDPSREARLRYVESLNALESRLKKIDPAGLDPTDRTTWSIMAVRLRHEQESLLVDAEELSVSASIAGDLSQILMLVPQASLTDAPRAEAYLQRLEALGAYFDSVGRRGLQAKAEGRYPTATGVRQAIAQLDDYLSSSVSDDPLCRPAPPGDIDASEWRRRAEETVTGVIRPALGRLRGVWSDDLLPVGRDDDHVGLCFVPGGAEGYQALIQVYTSTGLSAAEIHEMGVRTLAEIRAEIEETGASALDSRDVAETLRRLRDDPDLRFDSAEHIVSYVTDAYRRSVAALPSWFRPYDIPACDIREMSEHQARSGAAGYYLWPSVDGSRPGAFWLNTHKPQERPIALYEVIAFHEAVPGHHLQAVLGAEADLPKFRRYRRTPAHAEGWGLYVERLADEMGLYSTPIARLGMLSGAAFRACRLVVDTGLHHLGWSRKQAMNFMRDNTAQPELEIEAEVERYIAMPAQALAYMVGQLHITNLRATARQQLGAHFDIAEFHHQILGGGSMPLATLDEHVANWIDGVQLASG
jgi:uncharacterized protein (DUF885 family)